MNSFAKFIGLLGHGKLKRRKKATKLKPPWRAASIEARNICPCSKVLAITDFRFLIDKVPVLPLDGCDRTDICRCRYVRHSDRRSNNIRRDIDLDIFRRPYLDTERRIARSARRSTG